MTEFVDIDLKSRDPKFSLENTKFSVPISSNIETFKNILIKYLKDKNNFDFFINDQILKNESLKFFIDRQKISTESKIVIEYETRKDINIEFYLKHENIVSCIDVCNDLIVTGSYDKNLYLWNYAGNPKNKLLCSNNLDSEIFCVKFIDNDLIASGGIDCKIKISKIKKNKIEPLVILSGLESSVTSIEHLKVKGNFLISTEWNGQVRAWDLFEELNNVSESHESTPLMTIGSHLKPPKDSKNLKDTKFITCGDDCTVKIWEVESASLLQNINGEDSYNCLDYCASKNLIAAGTDQKSVDLFDLNSRDNLTTNISSCHNNIVSVVKFCPHNENLMATASWDGTALLWDLRSLKTSLSLIHKKNSRIFTGCWDKSLLIGGSDGFVYSYQIN